MKFWRSGQMRKRARRHFLHRGGEKKARAKLTVKDFVELSWWGVDDKVGDYAYLQRQGEGKTHRVRSQAIKKDLIVERVLFGADHLCRLCHWEGGC